jgi:surface antigen
MNALRLWGQCKVSVINQPIAQAETAEMNTYGGDEDWGLAVLYGTAVLEQEK